MTAAAVAAEPIHINEMNQNLSDSRLANLGAKAVHISFGTFHSRFKEITRGAKDRFLNRDWSGLQKDATERLDLYRQSVAEIEADIRELLADRLTDKLVWAGMKAVYSGRIIHQNDWELAETYFNSLTRRIFATVGVDQRIEFVSTDFASPPTPTAVELFKSYDIQGGIAGVLRRILEDCRFGRPLKDAAGQAAAIANRIAAVTGNAAATAGVERIDIIRSLFFRNQGAFLVGRIITAAGDLPLAVALQHPPAGIVVDAVLLDEDSLSVLFSFTRSYFLVFTERPYDLVRFLKGIMPRKRTAELYTAIGYNKHGKTEFYRDIVHYTQTCGDEQFEPSPGIRGMVMIVFNLPQDDLVLKLIRDRFHNPKTVTRRKVLENYDLVFKHDRAGRLVEAHVFEFLKFDRCWFSDRLLDELLTEASQTVHLEKNDVVIRHAYVERRVTPLDLYLATADPEAAAAAVVDFGSAIKDLAVSNIFPGDMLLKNFGVTRHGRVVFYDYDELCPLTKCHFRKIPPPRSAEEELSNETWFAVGEDDVFPEEFARYVGLKPSLKAVLMKHHGDLFDVDFWRDAQNTVAAGEVPNILPYPPENRLQ